MIKFEKFDHNEILNKAHNYLKDELIDKQMGFELLPEKFTLTELQNLYETIFKDASSKD